MRCTVYGGVSGQDDVAAISAALATSDDVLLAGTFSHPTGALVKVVNRSNVSLRGPATLNNIYGPDVGETSGAIVIGNYIRQANAPISVYHAPNSIIGHNTIS